MEYFLYGMVAGVGITIISLIITALLLFPSKPNINLKDEDIGGWEA
jgi:hypothetical protein